MSQSQHDQALIHQAQAGNKVAFNTLYQMHQSRVRTLVAKYAQDADDLEDLQQTVFVKAFLGIKRFRGDAAFTTWLTRIAINVGTTHLRSLRTQRNRQTKLEQLPEQQPENSPEDMTLKHEQLRLVKQGIRSLPKPQRRAVWLRYMKDFSYQEIVQELNVPLGTVKIWLHRGKHQLKRELEKLMLLQMETGMNV